MKGLTSQKADDFLKQYGLNQISEPSRKHLIVKFIEQFNNFLTYLLIGAAFFSFFLGETIDGTLIISIVVLNAFFGLYQEAKAEESLKALKEMTITKVRVFRDDRQIEIDSKFLVPGDVVYLEEGIKITADGKIIEAINLEINEAALTGESLAVVKKESAEVFSGTIVARGRGLMEVTQTGDQTKFGSIARNLVAIKEGLTPLQKKLASLTRFIGIGGIILSGLVFLISLLEGIGYFPSFLLAISLAVAVVPEGLPAVMTITLAIGMNKMAKKRAIVRKLSAIEALGSITLIATDKTGTLTTNKMQVKEIFTESTKSKKLLILDGILCSTASLVYIHDHGSWDVLGDPTEGALLYLAQKEGVNIDEERKKWQLIDEKPFDSVTKMMSVIVKRQRSPYRKSSDDTGIVTEKRITFSKGAPESIINVCKLTNKEKEKIEKQVKVWAEKGLRVLAFSQGSTFLGMVAIHDAPRIEVEEALNKTKAAGIKVVMITGDNEKTAEAIGVGVGLISEGDEILTGEQVEEYNDQELLALLPRVKIFARTNPFQKHRIVKLYQELGEVVAVTGDGVNDAIALKQADVGVAMGRVGTDVARETADMVITDDNFSTIVSAIEEGRGIINNIKNAIKYLLSCNVSEAVALIIGLVFGLPALFYPIQLLYINLVTDGLPALMLSFSPRDPQIMRVTPQKEMELLRRRDQIYIGVVGTTGAILVIVAFFLFGSFGTTAAFSVLTMIQSFVFVDLWLSHRHIHQNLIHLFKPLFIVAFSIPLVLQFIILSHPFSAGLFKVYPVTTLLYLQFLALSFFVLLGIRVVKSIVKF
jgi:Ca2+-transporting ATPase